ncbi:MAG TPA: type II toxin-antitoxin system HipA family toxin [Gallionella sp.]|nr:type II toxin-antitoxin system HipA family toxin [Gallionella sp.]
MDALDVFRGGEKVGTLYDEMPLRFEYAESWCNRPDAIPVDPGLDTAVASHAGAAVEAYFENLLPEARVREFLQLRYQTTTVFGLLKETGGDTAGDLVLVPRGGHPGAPSYRAASWEEIGASIGTPSGGLQEQSEEGIRISLAGAQTKTSVLLHADGTPAIPLGTSPSTHIVKPDIKGMEGVWCSALNETMVMKLAAAVGMGVAETAYQPLIKACVVKRYDRVPKADGNIVRLHQLDLCQLDGKPSTIKYEADGGPGLARCYRILRENGVPASDLKRLLQWVFFNLFVGNHDGHAKNLSLYYPPGEGARLAPFYDLLSTTLYAGLSRKFALRLGGENLPGKMDRACIERMCAELGVKSGYAVKLADEVAAGIAAHTDGVAHELAKITEPGSEQTMLERLSQHILGNAKKVSVRLR